MQIVTSIDDLRAITRGTRREGGSIGLVPTMGNLHAGHHSLVALARERASLVVASVFVNPTQFGPNEDFARYPRTPDDDARGLAAHGCDVLFLPDVATMYPLGADDGVRVAVPGLSNVLEGAIRPGHFDGVATVVSKLFNLVQPDVAVFGRKDYQQLLVIRRLVLDLCFGIEIIGAPIVREEGGLAMSSRNQYLDAGQRQAAREVHATLRAMVGELREGDRPLDAIEADASRRLVEAGFVPDYAVFRDAATLAVPGPNVRRGLVALVAARFGGVRLIDNLVVDDPAS